MKITDNRTSPENWRTLTVDGGLSDVKEGSPAQAIVPGAVVSTYDRPGVYLLCQEGARNHTAPIDGLVRYFLVSLVSGGRMPAQAFTLVPLRAHLTIE